MRIQTLAGTRSLSDEPPRSTAYYYADIERLKRKNDLDREGQGDPVNNTDEGSQAQSDTVAVNPLRIASPVATHRIGQNDPNGPNLRIGRNSPSSLNYRIGLCDLRDARRVGQSYPNGSINPIDQCDPSVPNYWITQSETGRRVAQSEQVGRVGQIDSCLNYWIGQNDPPGAHRKGQCDPIGVHRIGQDSSASNYWIGQDTDGYRIGQSDGSHRLGHTDPDPQADPNELSEYVESNEVVNDGAIREVPPLRDRQWSLPEYSTPENRKEETYSTAGTFPMPEPKEKEPLLAELEVVGRVPLTQLDSSPGVRRSRSWYLCCPNVGDEEIARDSSWRYSSLRPVTAPPIPGRNGMVMVATQSSGRPEDASTLRAERDSLARALAAERQRAATAARAHDARLAELHGVIAELVRRRAADKQTSAIPEEEVSDECESTTQPAGELDNDADHSRTEQNDTSSLLSPTEARCAALPADSDCALDPACGTDQPRVLVTSEGDRETEDEVEREDTQGETEGCEVCLQFADGDSELCVSSARCCQAARPARGSARDGGSCERDDGSGDSRLRAPSAGRCSRRQAKLACRVRLRRTDDCLSDQQHSSDDTWCAEAAERLALDVCAQAGRREARVAAALEGASADGALALWRARCARLAADCRVLQCALARATDTAHRLSCACAVQESSCVSLCAALRAADRALETYDVLLALAETQRAAGGAPPGRAAAESVALELLTRLETEALGAPSIGEPLLSPGPWLQRDQSECGAESTWSAEREARLRAHAARLKRDTVALRALRPPPRLYSHHDADEEAEAGAGAEAGGGSMAEMEAAVMMQEVLAARESRAAARARGAAGGSEGAPSAEHKGEWPRARRRARARARASETDL